MHVFLTGQVQVGKSTLLRRVLAELPPLRLGGFRTVTAADVPGAVGSVYIFPAAGPDVPGDDCRVALRLGPPRGVEAYPAVFDHRGVELPDDPMVESQGIHWRVKDLFSLRINYNLLTIRQLQSEDRNRVDSF